MKTRMIRKPNQFSGDQLNGFFMISNKDAAIAITNKLTGSQIRLWLYLMMIDPFADFSSNGEIIYHKLPSVAEMAIQLGVNSETVEKDLRKLKKLKLYSYRVTELQGHNLAALKARQISESLKKKTKSQSQQAMGEFNPQKRLFNLFELETQSQQRLGEFNPQEGLNNPQEGLNNLFKSAETIDFNRVLATPQTIQTIQIDQTPPLPPQGEREREEILISNGNGKQVDNLSVSNQETEIIISPQSRVTRLDPYFPACNTRRNKNTTQDLPDGPWMVEYQTTHGRVERKLDQNFLKYMADTWFKDPNFNKNSCKDIYQVMIDVLRYFRKDPTALSDRWEQYSMKMAATFENAQLRTQHGIEIKPEEQQYLLNHARAVTNPLPEEMSAVAKPKIELLPHVPINQPAISAHATAPVTPAAIEDKTDWVDNIPEEAENPQAYKPYIAPAESAPMTFEQMEEIKKRVAANHAAQATQTVEGVADHKFTQWLTNYFFKHKHEDLSMPQARFKAATTLKNKTESMKFWKQYKQETISIFDVIGFGKNMKPVEEAPSETERERLQRELNDPILHKEAIKKARGGKFSIDFDGCQWIVSEEGW